MRRNPIVFFSVLALCVVMGAVLVPVAVRAQVAVAAAPAPEPYAAGSAAVQAYPMQPVQPVPPIYPGGCWGPPTAHAQGQVQGNQYFVVWGDTLFSISRRFCVSIDALRATNGIWGYLQANTWIVIPGAGPVWPTPVWPTPVWPTPVPTVTPIFPFFLTVDSPAANATLQSPFAVNGSAPNGTTVLVRAEDNGGRLLAEQSVTLPPGPLGGRGNWGVQLTVNVLSGTPGRIVASGAELQPVTVPVTFGSNVQRFVTIDSPAPGSQLQGIFTVSGRGGGLFEGNVVLQAFNRSTNQPLGAPVATTLQGPNVGTGGEGTYSTQLNVTVPQQTEGYVRASSDGVTPATVNVIFAAAVRCTITPNYNAPYFNSPNGAVVGFFQAPQPWNTTGREIDAFGTAWYRVEPGPGGAVVWVPGYAVMSISPDCRF